MLHKTFCLEVFDETQRRLTQSFTQFSSRNGETWQAPQGNAQF